eukprot:scaffold49693_cov32-Tisochrysis_lutea.AAC.4
MSPPSPRCSSARAAAAGCVMPSRLPLTTSWSAARTARFQRRRYGRRSGSSAGMPRIAPPWAGTPRPSRRTTGGSSRTAALGRPASSPCRFELSPIVSPLPPSPVPALPLLRFKLPPPLPSRRRAPEKGGGGVGGGSERARRGLSETNGKRVRTKETQRYRFGGRVEYQYDSRLAKKEHVRVYLLCEYNLSAVGP